MQGSANASKVRLARGDGLLPSRYEHLFALRVAIYTGVRHRSELLWTRLECRLADSVPRIGIPRAKGDRAKKGGRRWIFLSTRIRMGTRLGPAAGRPPPESRRPVSGRAISKRVFQKFRHPVLKCVHGIPKRCFRR